MGNRSLSLDATVFTGALLVNSLSLYLLISLINGIVAKQGIGFYRKIVWIITLKISVQKNCYYRERRTWNKGIVY
jgi:hypothetical protein